MSLKAKARVLHVSFRPNHDKEILAFSDVWLTGPTVQVFKGEVLYDLSLKLYQWKIEPNSFSKLK